MFAIACRDRPNRGAWLWFGSPVFSTLVTFLFCVAWTTSIASAGTPEQLASSDKKSIKLPELRLGPKPPDEAVERRAHPQSTVPDGTKELPFIELAPEPILTSPERERGYLLFQRPVTESIY